MVGGRFVCAQLAVLFTWARAAAVLLLCFPSLLLSSIPDLEEAVPGASGNSHTVCCHPEAAHSVVVARKDSCEGRKKRGQEEKQGLGEMKLLNVLRTCIVGCVPAPLCAVCSCTTFWNQSMVNKSIYAWHIKPPPMDRPQNIHGKVWLAASLCDCFYMGAMVGLRKEGITGKAEE